MTRISLIGIVHYEDGHANCKELVSILERVRPEVIFLETSTEEFDCYLEGTCTKLESLAARECYKTCNAIPVPVDLPLPDGSFFREYGDFCRQIARTSPRYLQLDGLNSQLITENGFTYLNSASCAKHWSDIHLEILDTIAWTGSRRLRDYYDLWRRTHELRELAMVQNIYEYCAQNTVGSGVFLVGAAHRQPIMDKLRLDEKGKVSWDFFGFLGAG